MFNEHFGNYVHVNETSGYNRQLNLYHWNVYVYLNPTFDFLPEHKKNPVKFLSEITEDDCEIVRIASFTDAEGWVGIESNKGRPAVILYISNNSRQLLELTQRTIGGNINQDHGGYKLVLRGDEAVEVIRELPIRHEEKVAAKELILRHYDNRGIRIEALTEYRELRRKIDEEVRLCTMQARLEWIVRHGKPHRDDSDQTIPTM